MVRELKAAERETLRGSMVGEWAEAHGIDLSRFDLGQQWVIFFALGVIAHLGKVAGLKRVVGYLLAVSKMDLGSTAIAAIVGVSDRAIRNAQSLDPEAMLHSVQHPVGGHRKPKLEAHHAGVVAKFLVEHPRARVQDVLSFITQELSVTIDRLTLRRYIARYGLGCLRGDMVTNAPFFSDEPVMEELSY
jgi:hypothetical protein